MRFWNKKKYAKLYNSLKEGNLASKYYVDSKIRHNDVVIMLWKKPFIKGSGVLISKKYKLKK